ncbi:hypothetical protein SDC9_46302 [bioreactor metagenome]|uniref:Replication initiator A N-terminal domain-containing protein n=1 Tax=bioreactor metagenome TaxID=1076179 RepID=A0A644W924_9ZZZZ
MKYYQMPKVFFTNEKYKKLSNDAKILYALLHDRLQVSIKNKWIDSTNSLYFIFTNQKLSEILNVSPRKITTIKKELLDTNLLDQKQKSFNAPFHLYLMKPEITVDDMYQMNQTESGADLLRVSPEIDAAKEERSSVANSARLEESASASDQNSVAEFATLNKTASNQPSHSLANSATPVSQILLPNKTNLNNTKHKDNKEYKDQRLADNSNNHAFNQAFQTPPENTETFMIEQFIQDKTLLDKYGERFVDVLLSYSRNNYALFSEAVEAVEHATKSAEKERVRSLERYFHEEMSAYSHELRADYLMTLYNVLRHLRTNASIRDPKAYFFISFKKLALHWIEILELDETQTESVPTFDYLRTVESTSNTSNQGYRLDSHPEK